MNEMAAARLGITWSLSAVHGWGVFGVNLVRTLLERGGPDPLLLRETPEALLDPGDLTWLRPLLDEGERLRAEATPPVTLADTVVLHSLGNGLFFNPASEAFAGERNIGVAFVEDTHIGAPDVQRLAALDGMIAGSTWNATLLRDAGFANVHCVQQGVDTTTFNPAPGPNAFGDRFTVFAGGKLEFRKGQDIVVAAFRRFQERHADALLVTQWQNPWPATMASMAESPHGAGAPDVSLPAEQAIARWVHDQGVPEGAHVELGAIANPALPELLRDMRAALFTNRCEGGTNLVAMETMACGVPCIIADNTGQRDLIGDGNCVALSRQRPVADTDGLRRDWGESDVDEAVDALERLYGDRSAASEIGTAGSGFMRDWNWRRQVERLLAAAVSSPG